MTYSSEVRAEPMEHHPWQRRARAAGLSQRTLSRLLGFAEITVSRQLRGHWESGTPDHVIAAILAWEIMTPEMRDRWLAAADRVRMEKLALAPSIEKPKRRRRPRADNDSD
ncbi:hypothetical protein [Methylobacterium sp. WSM2598]|uniref:hypothetical protein n=1 Tax=Methylobacterium sp. WSM2598 TaxID=398261 RepID=UPI0012F62331|nr:hypothetical protein [Methylobacterium sp. WSM2598]